MNEIKIIELSLRNFKGIKDLNIKPEGKNLFIYGENATGKTTIMDAFIWLLFDKDSANSSNFSIKTLDDKGNVIHGLEHEVIAKLEIDGKEVELQKIYTEKWTKKRGQAESELTGNTTDYFVNGVPKKKSEYIAYLGNIINEDTFKIITNPLYFNTNLKWQDRRDIALSICGQVGIKEIIDQDNSLKELEELLVDKSIDDLKAEMAARRRKLNEELKSIPYRIDELSRENTEVDVEALSKEKKELESQLQEVKSAKSTDYEFKIRVINGSISVMENELREMEQNLTKEIRQNINESMESNSKIKKAYYEAKNRAEELTLRIKTKNTNIDRLNKEMEELRNKFKEVSANTFDVESTICPTCKQSLPAEEIDKHIAEFEDYKQHTLAEINNKGKIKKADLECEATDLAGSEVNLTEVNKEIYTLSEILEGKETEIKELENELKSIDITKLPGYQEIKSKIDNLNSEKEEYEKLQLNEDKTDQVKKLESQISEVSKELSRVDLIKDNEKRIKDLKNRERELAQMVAETEKIEFLCGQFTITKSNLLENRLNDKFSLVKFKLFDVLVNGGIDDTFVTTVDGVPFDDLNNAMKINAGLDIINTLTNYYNFKAPIFIDNRESVNQIIDVSSQVINLIVSKDKKLKVEVEE